MKFKSPIFKTCAYVFCILVMLRGVSDHIAIRIKTSQKRDIMVQSASSTKSKEWITIHNNSFTKLNLFFQSTRGTNSQQIDPGRVVYKSLGGAALNSLPSVDCSSHLEMFVSTTRSLCVVLSVRQVYRAYTVRLVHVGVYLSIGIIAQEIRDFPFNPGPIGIEVEMNSTHKVHSLKINLSDFCQGLF